MSIDIPKLVFLLLVGGFVAAASAYLGSFMVLKRMSLVGDALSHVALPGMAIAISLGISPTLGAFVALMLAILGIWYLEKTSNTYPEALVGVFFTASLALGVLLIRESELLEALFGSIEKIGPLEGIISVAVSLAIIILTYLISKKLILSIISEDLAVSSGVKLSWVNLLYLVLVGTIVSLGIRFVGTLLMGALVIVPAVAARNISRSIRSYFLLSIVFSVLSSALGIYISSLTNAPVGAVVVLASIFIYLISYLLSKFRK